MFVEPSSIGTVSEDVSAGGNSATTGVASYGVVTKNKRLRKVIKQTTTPN